MGEIRKTGSAEIPEDFRDRPGGDHPRQCVLGACRMKINESGPSVRFFVPVCFCFVGFVGLEADADAELEPDSACPTRKSGKTKKQSGQRKVFAVCSTRRAATAEIKSCMQHRQCLPSPLHDML